MSETLDQRALGEFLRAHHKNRGDRLFRREGLPRYNVPAQAAELARWQAGAIEPNWDAKQPWLDILAQEKSDGLISQRVRLFGRELTDDEQMACHWGYALNSAYEEIGVLREGEHHIPSDLIEHDYWLVNGQFAVPMVYNEAREFVHAIVLPQRHVAAYRRDAERLLAAAEPWDNWWGRHGELQRRAA
jgi:hypothetical protein